MFRRIHSALVGALLALVLSSSAQAEVVTIPFNEGFVGLRGSNNQDADTVVTFGDLGFDATFFTQVSATGVFIGSGAQGNDVAGTLRLRRGSTIYNIDGRIGWQLKEQGNLMLFGFLPNSNISTIALTTPSGYSLPAGIMMEDVADLDPNSSVYTTAGGETVYYITGASNFGVTKFGLSLSDIKPLTSSPRGIDTGEDVGGSADGSGILDALNAYLATAATQRPLGPITVDSQTTADTTPVVTGLVTLQAGEYLVIVINGEVYMTADGVIGPNDDGIAGAWSIEIPTGNDLTAGNTYDVSAMIFNAAGWLLDDSTTNELTISNGVTPVPALKVQKSVNDSTLLDGADVGDTLTYQVLLTNTGNVPLYDLAWTDTLSNGTGNSQTLVLGTPVKSGSGASTIDGSLLEVGDTLTFTISYALTQADIDSGEIGNLASAQARTSDGDASTAFVVESSPTGNTTSGTGNGSATLRTLTRSPAITVTKSVAHTDSDNDGAVSLGDTLTYTVTAENTGNVTLQGLSLSDDFQRADNTVLSATLSAIAYSTGSSDSAFLPGGTASATFAHIINQDDVDAGGLSNAASGTAWIDLNGDSQRASDSSEDATDTTDSRLDTAIGSTGAIALTKTASLNDGGDGVDAGDTITYSFTVENTGAVSLSNIEITDPMVTVQGTLATLAVGASDSTTFTATYTITQVDIDAGTVSNTATVTADSPSGTDDVTDTSSETGSGDSATVTTLTRAPAITVTKSVAHTDSDNDGAVSLGDTLTYTVTAENTGNVTLQGLSLSDDFQRADNTVLSATLSAIAYSTGSSDSAFLSGGTASATFAHIIDQDDVDAGGLSNAASGAAWIDLNGDSQRASDSSEDATDTTDSRLDTAIGSTGAIALTKTATLNDGGDGVDAGDTITYSFTVQNTGAVSLSNIEITDPMVIVQGTLATLSVGATDSTTFSATYTITQADIDTGEVSNTATVTADSPSGTDDVTDTSSATGSGNSATVTSLTRSPAITVTKSVAHTDSDNDGAVSLGDTLTYTVTAENTGNVTLQGLALSDDFQRADSTVLSATLSAIAYSTGSSDSAFLPGGTASATFAHIIDQDEVDAGGLSNAATGAAWIDLNGDSQRASDSSEDATDTTDSRLDTAIGSTGAIALTKTATLNDGGDGVDAGDTITYSFTVQNTGAVSLSNIEITDPMVIVQGTLATLSVGATDSTTFSATYTITQADIDTGEVSNTATVTADSPSGTDDVTDTSSATGSGDSATVTSLTRSPAITVTKSVAHTDSDNDGAVSLGDTLTYTVSAENTGNVTLQGLQVQEDFARMDGTSLAPELPAMVFSDGSSASSMPPGAVGVLFFSHTISLGDVDAGGVTNSASVSSWQDADQNGSRNGDGSEDVIDTVEQAVATPISGLPAIRVRKSGVLNDDDGVLGTSLGDTITYLLEVQNTGNVTLTDVQISDPLFGGVVPQTIPSLAPGETDSDTFALTYRVTRADLDRGFVSNLATATGVAASGTVSDVSGPTFDTDKEVVTFLGSISGHVTDGQEAKSGVAVVLIDQTTGQEIARVTTGSDGAYAFIQLEQGTYAICFIPPEGAAVHSYSDEGDPHGDLVEDIVVAAGADRIVTNVDAIVVDPSGVIYDAITRTPIQGATVTLLHNGTVVPDSWLDTAAGDANNVVTGANGMYGFLLQSPAQTGIYALRVSHSDYSFVSRIVPPQEGAYRTELGFGVEEIVPSVLAPVAAGGDETYYLEFDFTFADWTDQSTLSKGVIHNHIAMDPADISTELRVTKVADESALSKSAQVGEVIAYTITVENTGDMDFGSVALDDPLTLDEQLIPVVGTTDDGVLNVGEIWTYTAHHALTVEDLRRGEVQNLASVSAVLVAGSGVTPTGTGGGGTYLFESAPDGNVTEGAGNGTATVTKLHVDLIDQIKEDLITIIEDDIRVTMQRQTEMVSGWRAGALERMKTAIADGSALRSYETTDPISGGVEASAGSFSLDTRYEKERFDAPSRTWTINTADLTFSEDEALGTQFMLTFNHRREKLHDSDRLTGRYIGGYMTRTTVDTRAEGEINGFGLNAGLYGAMRPYQQLFLDYHLGAVAGKHSYDLDFARDLTINATGDFTYLGVTGGVAVSGEIAAGDTIIAPRIGVDGFYTPQTTSDVTARSGPYTEEATLEIGSVSSGRMFIETRFSNDLAQAHDGKGMWEGLDAELALTLRAFCDVFDELDTRCGFGAGLEYASDAKDKASQKKLTLGFDKSGDHMAARFGVMLEKHFAREAGTSRLNLSADQAGEPSLQLEVGLQF